MYKPKENKWDVETNNNYEKITDYKKIQIKKLINIQENLENIKSIFQEYISLTKKYCDQIATLALKLKPEGQTNEGEITQAIQGILLFNSVSLETLANEMEKICKTSLKEENPGIVGLDEFYSIYQMSLATLLKSYCSYINEIEDYEKYLMSKEMGLYKINDNLEENKEEKREKQDENIKEKNSNEIKSHNNSNNNLNKIEKTEPEKLSNNIEMVLKTKKKYMDDLNSINILIDKLVEYGINEEKLLNEEFYNISKIFVDKLIDCLEGQKKKYEGQSLVLTDLYDKIKSEKEENLHSIEQKYALHCLSVYINVKNISRNQINKSQNIVLNQRSKEFEIYKDITLENIENIIKEMEKNGLEIRKEDLNDFEMEKVKDFIEKKSKLITAKTDENFKEEDKNKIIEYFKENNEYSSFFLQLLNNDRAKGGSINNKNIFNYFCDIFKSLNDLVLEKNDYKYFKYVSIITMTYFINKGNKKIYLYEAIKNNEKLKNIKFWENYANYVVNSDIENDICKPEIKKEDVKKDKINFVAFSNVLTICSNMVTYGFDDNFINEFITYCYKHFCLSEKQVIQVIDLKNVWKASDSSVSQAKKEKNETNKGEIDKGDIDKNEKANPETENNEKDKRENNSNNVQVEKEKK